MAYFEPYIDVDGIHVPTYGDIIEYLSDRYKQIFGAEAYIGEETPDYQLLSVFAKCINDFSYLAVEAYNNRNPDYASGNSLDTLVRFGGMIRRTATYSTCVLTVEGEENTVIEAGKRAIDQSGNLWAFDEDVTIPESGTATGMATCQTAGAVVASIGFINGIYDPVFGWSGVTNTVEGDTGLNTETDAELRARFSLAHAITNSGVYDAIVTGLLSLQDVTFVDVVQNDTGAPVGDIPGHSICCLVEGGDEDEIASTILSLKSPGVGTYGTTTKTIVDDYGHSNTIKFSRPVEATTSVTINLTPLGNYDASRIDNIIKAAIQADINTLGIGKSWNVTMGYKDIYAQFDSKDMAFTITSISAVKDSTTYTASVPCDYDEKLKTDDDHITIVLPQ